MNRTSARRRSTPAWLRALGRAELPVRLHCNGVTYTRMRIFKHDFFAATGLYESSGRWAVYKVGRIADLFGLPMVWLGARLCRREVSAYRRLAGVPGVPALVGCVGTAGFLHEFVPGAPLVRGRDVHDDFFPRLGGLLDSIHARGMAYVDMEKPDNILVDDSGAPWLIDFQIAWFWPFRRGADGWPATWLLRRFQESDRYHLLKHWRRFRPDQLSTELVQRSRRKPASIRFHQWLFRPLTRIRRGILRKLDPARAIEPERSVCSSRLGSASRSPGCEPP